MDMIEYRKEIYISEYERKLLNMAENMENQVLIETKRLKTG